MLRNYMAGALRDLAAGVIYRQCIYVTRDALRVNTDQMLIIRSSCKPALLNELRALPGVRGAQCSSTALLNREGFGNYRLKDGTPLAIDVVELEFPTFGLYGIKPVAGTLPTAEQPRATDAIQNSQQVVINETAMRRFGFASADAAIGQSPPLADGAEAQRRIVAVVPDFSFDGHANCLPPWPLPRMSVSKCSRSFTVNNLVAPLVTVSNGKKRLLDRTRTGSAGSGARRLGVPALNLK